MEVLKENNSFGVNEKLAASCVGSGNLNVLAVKSLTYFNEQLTKFNPDSMPSPNRIIFLFDN